MSSQRLWGTEKPSIKLEGENDVNLETEIPVPRPRSGVRTNLWFSCQTETWQPEILTKGPKVSSPFIQKTWRPVSKKNPGVNSNHPESQAGGTLEMRSTKSPATSVSIVWIWKVYEKFRIHFYLESKLCSNLKRLAGKTANFIHSKKKKNCQLCELMHFILPISFAKWILLNWEASVMTKRWRLNTWREINRITGNL